MMPIIKKTNEALIDIALRVMVYTAYEFFAITDKITGKK
jgi:hypothetical protein